MPSASEAPPQKSFSSIDTREKNGCEVDEKKKTRLLKKKFFYRFSPTSTRGVPRDATDCVSFVRVVFMRSSPPLSLPPCRGTHARARGCRESGACVKSDVFSLFLSFYVLFQRKKKNRLSAAEKKLNGAAVCDARAKLQLLYSFNRAVERSLVPVMICVRAE